MYGNKRVFSSKDRYKVIVHYTFNLQSISQEWDEKIVACRTQKADRLFKVIESSD